MTANRVPLFSVEAETIAPIPTDRRHGKSTELVAIWAGMNMTPLTVVTGALATTVFGLSLWWSLLALILGHGIGGVGMALHAAQGPRLGVPQMLQARGQFGAYGASIIVLIATAMFIGFFSSNLVVAADSVTAIIPGLDSGPVLVACTLFSLVVAAFGYRLVRAMTALSAYIVGALVVISLAALFFSGDAGRYLTAGDFNAEGFFAMIAIGVVWQLAYAPYVSDYSRYMPHDTGGKGAFWGSYLGCVVSSVVLMLLGVVVGMAVGDADIMAGLNGLLGPVFGFAVLLGFALAASTGNSVNVYCSCLCVLTLLETFWRGWRPALKSRLVTTVVLHVIGLAIAFAAASDFASTYFNFLSFLLYALIPWSAINLVDYYLVRHADFAVNEFFAPDGGRYGQWNPGALIVFVIGVLVQVPFLVTTAYTGPAAVALGYVDVAWLVGFVVSGAVYLVIAKNWPGLVRLTQAAVAVEANQTA